MLLAEQIRNLEVELNLINDIADRCHTNITDWLTKQTYNITVPSIPADTLLMIYQKSEHGYGAGDYGSARITLDGVPIMTSGGQVGTDPRTEIIRYCITPITAGAHTILAQVAGWLDTYTLDACSTEVIAGIINLKDTKGYRYDSGLVNVADGAWADLISETINIPAARDLCVGSLSKYIMHVFAYCYTGATRANRMRNNGESQPLNESSFYLQIDGVDQDWTERRDDDLGISNLTFGEGAWGLFMRECDPSESFVIKIRARNRCGAAKDLRAVISIVISPWILPFTGEFNPVDFDFPEGSTLYVTLEPLHANPTKYIRLGKARARSFGDATDYYSIDSGVDILDWDFTFELFQIEDIWLMFEGWGGLISMFGVDVR